MTELEANIKAKLKLTELPTRAASILNHYHKCIAKGMKLAYATDLALANLSGSNRHDTIRGQGND